MNERLLACILGVLVAVPAAAQTCGDATDDGTVTVTDGVQALRAAAGLSSTCEDGCDVDGSGGITVSDGVNVLRKAAGIAVNEACEFTAQEANGVVDPSLSVFGAMTKVPGVGGNALAAAGECDNAEGSIETVAFGNSSAATFTNCRLGGAVVDGTIGRAVLAQGVVLGFDGFQVRRVKTGETHTIDGQLGVSDVPGVGKRIAGTLNADSSARGSFTILFQRILLAGDGSVRQGSLVYDLSKTTGGKIARVQIDFSDADLPPAVVTLRTQKVKQFLLDRNAGLLIPAV
ncbi:MAG: hypothetical protein IT293_20890 [Deltaproteobacteria bacterium]|nr:hypothetical protein [Deltaproteobacteria bacterium]